MKYFEVLDETSVLFEKVLGSTSIPNWVEFKVLGNNDMKDVYQVKKLSELYEFIADGMNIVVVINEEIFDQLTEDQKTLLFEEALSGVLVSESDKISLEGFDFNTYGGMLFKHGLYKMVTLKESIKSLFDIKKLN